MSIALYRRFRPEAFNEVIGQEQVTVPLMAALRAGKVNHAYLFSGPRGCGKTTSARILARTLNCAKNTEAHPLDTPCGECESCIELSRLGSGSIDVVEIDAASHGGVDAARDLRERATFTPSRDRFKIFIIDEAHMVTKEGFNALLKVVEEPPPHIKFIFATTEPDKVLGTIRSRTHHYPFRLVPSEILAPYLEQLAGLEGASLGPGVVPLVIRAGGGSVRDSLSVLDQLIAGAPDGNVTAERAVELLGYTPAAMLDEAVAALAAYDGGSLFAVVNRVIDNGNPPQRFAEDLLQRFRDLIVVSVTGDGAAAVFREWSPDEVASAQAAAALFGNVTSTRLGTMTRIGETISTGLSSMVGATSPRLQLELLCARLLVPIGPEQIAARLSKLENTLATGNIPGSPTPTATAAATIPPTPTPTPKVAQVPAVAPTSAPVTPATSAPLPAPIPQVKPPSAERTPPRHSAASTDVRRAQNLESENARLERITEPVDTPASGVETPRVAGDLERLKTEWPNIVASIPSPVTGPMLKASSGPVAVDGSLVRIGFPNQTLAGRLAEPRHANALSLVLSERLGRQVTVEGVVSGAAPQPPSQAIPVRDGVAPGVSRQGAALPQPTGAVSGPGVNPVQPPVPPAASAAPAWDDDDDAAWLAGESIPLKVPAAPEPPPKPELSPNFFGVDSAPPPLLVESQNDGGVDSALPASATAEPVSAPPAPPVQARQINIRTAASEDEADPDDAEVDQSFISGVPLVIEMLNGTVISEEVV